MGRGAQGLGEGGCRMELGGGVMEVGRDGD